MLAKGDEDVGYKVFFLSSLPRPHKPDPFPKLVIYLLRHIHELVPETNRGLPFLSLDKLPHMIVCKDPTKKEEVLRETERAMGWEAPSAKHPI